MFNSSLYGRRAGRIAFGTVLFAGTAVLVQRLVHGGPLLGQAHAWQIIAATWIAAAVVGKIVAVASSGSARDPQGMFKASVVVPSIGIALLLPLTLQMPFLLGDGGAAEFDGWAKVSLPIAGATHLVFAALVALRASRLVEGGVARVITPGQIYVIVIAVSCIPFALLYMIPPVIVALTGLPILPLLYAMKNLVERERAAVPELPRAIATPVA